MADDLIWRKSSRSCDTANCVEFASTTEGVAVRDSKNPDGPILTFGRAGWTAFLAGIRAEEFEPA